MQELGARVPIIIRAPHMRGGVVSNVLVESVDLYPTISSLAGLPPPGDLDGVDLSPLFHDPATPLKPNVAFSEYPRCASPETPWDDRSSCVNTERKNFNVMGLSVRVPEWGSIVFEPSLQMGCWKTLTQIFGEQGILWRM